MDNQENNSLSINNLSINSLYPESAPVGWQGSLTIHGSNLGEAGFVSIDGHSPQIIRWTAINIQVQVTSLMTATAGSKRLVVHDRNGNLDETQWPVR